MNSGESRRKIDGFFSDVVRFFKYFKSSALYWFSELIYAAALFIIAALKTIESLKTELFVSSVFLYIILCAALDFFISLRYDR